MTSTATPLDAVKAFKTAAWTSAERAQIYDQTTNSKTDLTHYLTTEYIGALTQRIAPRTQVLDLGCGTGVLTKALAALGHEVTGVDISQAMLDKIDTTCASGSITLRQGDVYALPFADASFEGVITRWVVPHFRDWPTILKEAGRVLRPGGVMVFDHTSRANYDLAAREGVLDHAKFGYDPRARGGDKSMFYAAASVDELQLAADVAGLELMDVAPLGFFRQNAVIAGVLGGEGFLAYKKAIDTFFQDDGARAFIKWFERNVTPALPLSMVNGMSVVLRRRAGT
jgi:ubiquinone/menaquinone biosynthesis C-methylase UbiE